MRLAAMTAVAIALVQTGGQRIAVHDGDLIVSDYGARVRFVRHAEGQLRLVYNPAQHTLQVLLDYTGAQDRQPDGRVDVSYYFRGVPSWPAAERWDGRGSLDQYSTADAEAPGGIGVTIPGAFIQLITSLGATPAMSAFKDPAATAILTFTSLGHGGGPSVDFDTAERVQAERMNRPAPPGAFQGGPTVIAPPPPPTPGSYPPPSAPVRVGGNIRQPMKIADAKPVFPSAAAEANIRGVVILEIVIGTDGSVTQAKVLRSIPLLDQPAIDAVKQWRYEVTQLNGQPVPVIMTVTVSFP